MRKLIVTCECGAKMYVPHTSIGKRGICSGCGRTVAINANNTAAVSNKSSARFFGAKQFWNRVSGQQPGGGGGGAGEPPEDAKRKFGEAVDLFYQQRYAEALAIFDILARQFPGNPNIDNGRQQCLSALKRPHTLAIEDKGPKKDEPQFDQETVKRIILEKMISGSTEAVQLQAAELACRVLGLFHPPSATLHTGNGHATHQEPPKATEDPVETATTATSSSNGEDDSKVTPPGLYDLDRAPAKE